MHDIVVACLPRGERLPCFGARFSKFCGDAWYPEVVLNLLVAFTLE